MILTCPECKSRYVVNPKALMPKGRTVRCAKCRHSWFEEKPDQDIEIIPEQKNTEEQITEQSSTTQQQQKEKPVGNIATSTETTDNTAGNEAEDAEALPDFDFPINKPKKRKRPVPKGSNLPALQNQKYGSSKAGWISLFVFLTVIISSFLLLEDGIKKTWPATAKLYRAIGLDNVNDPTTQTSKNTVPINDLLKISGLEPRLEEINDISYIFIAGYVENISDETQTIPPLKVVLKDINGQDLRSWSFIPATTNVAAGAQVPFETSLPSPPAEARDISVILTNP